MTKNKPKKKKVNVQRKTLGNEASKSEDSCEEKIADDAIVSCSGARTLGWSGVHIRPNVKVQNRRKQLNKSKFTGVHGVRNLPKIKAN